MKNNKGFSVVELIVSFSLTMVIVVILFEIIVAMKDLYVSSVTKTELLNKQNIFTDYIYSDIYNHDLEVVSICGENCISFTFRDGNSKNLKWAFYSDENTSQALPSISYGDYKINLIANSTFDSELSFNDGTTDLMGVKICNNITNNYFQIKIPIYNNMFKNEDFGLDILYSYEDYEVDFNMITGVC